jgi:hypothetical protein
MKKADNFNAMQWLTENKITTQSKLNERPDWVNPEGDPYDINIKNDPIINGPNDRHNVWKGEPQIIPGELSDELSQYSDRGVTIDSRISRKKNLNGYGMFHLISFKPKRLYYNKRNPSGYYGQYVVGFEKDDKVYPGELEMLKALLQNIKDSGIKSNNENK